MSGISQGETHNQLHNFRTASHMLRQGLEALTRPRLIAFLLFLAALLPRLPGLGRFLTSDEKTNIFIAGSDVIAAFLSGNLRETYWHFYPGVTMSWLDALGMGGQYLLDLLRGSQTPGFSEFIYSDILSLVVATRLPYAILTAAAIPAIYLLARKLLSERIALLGALLMAFDPFYLAHSRVAHGDAPVAVFMSLSALAFFIYAERVYKWTHEQIAESRFDDKQTTRMKAGFIRLFRHRFSIYLILSAIFGSLAALTKAPGQFIAFFIIGVAMLYAGLGLWRANRKQPLSDSPPLPDNNQNASTAKIYIWPLSLRWITVIMAWSLMALIVFILLWPSMWVDPIGTVRQVWTETFDKVNEGHLVYFFGTPTLDPGFWFYFYVIPFRMTPIILIGSLLSLAWLVFRIGPGRKWEGIQTRAILLLWLFTITLLLFSNLSPKKQDRYLLPLFPFLNLLAAVGWLGLFNIIGDLIQINSRSVRTDNKANISNYRSLISTAVIILLIFLHLVPVFTYYPYYLTYFNPLLGGPTRAAETTLMGWGEGMEQVAAYLNTKPNAQDLYVASTPSQTLLPYFAGSGENFYTNDIALRADYVVLYLAQRQRLAPSPEIVRYFESQPPEKVITIKGVPYAKIYPGPQLILSDIPAGINPVNIGLDDTIRLAGYEIASAQSPTPQLQITLYWHALKSLANDYTVSVRIRAADGRLLDQRDSWPVDGLLPTSQWRQGDYVADTHTLDISKADLKVVNSLEVVVYNQETGETLGPSITLALENSQ